MSTPPTPGPSPSPGPGRIIALVFGSLLSLVALALVLCGLGVIFAHAVLRDDAGFLNAPSERLTSPTRAITAERIDLGDTHDGDWAIENLNTTVRVRASLAGGAPVFVGIARERDLDRYLSGIAHDEVRDWNASEPQYARSAGTGVPRAPGTQRFWVASASGTGVQQVRWDPSGGDWGAVIMRASGRPGIDTDVKVGVKVPWLLWLGLGLLAAGTVFAAGGAGLIWTGVHRPHAHGTAPVAPGVAPAAATVKTEAAAATGYPVDIRAELDESLSPWLWLVKWILAIPHYIVLALLSIAFVVLTIIAFFAVLVTGRYPRAMFDFNVGVLRWSWRVAFYATHAIATDRYPPFSLQPDPAYPADLDIPYPERLSRGKVLVKSWLLAIPHYAVLAAFLGGGGWVFSESWVPGLLPVLVLVAGVILLFTGRYPRDVFRLIVGINRWIVRVIAYAALMRDEYPPFRLDP